VCGGIKAPCGGIKGTHCFKLAWKIGKMNHGHGSSNPLANDLTACLRSINCLRPMIVIIPIKFILSWYQKIFVVTYVLGLTPFWHDASKIVNSELCCEFFLACGIHKILWIMLIGFRISSCRIYIDRWLVSKLHNTSTKFHIMSCKLQ
jgi:hypothetical protein